MTNSLIDDQLFPQNERNISKNISEKSGKLSTNNLQTIHKLLKYLNTHQT